jgi:hypothetical protein
MQTDRLFLNGMECDLSPSTVIALNFQINDLAELKDRQANFSQQFKIPKTARNREILEDSELIQSLTVRPYRKIPARVEKNNIDVVPYALAFVESSSENYSVTIYSGIISFFDKIEGKQLEDLDLTDMDHSIDILTVVASRTNTTGLKYSIIDFGNLVNTDRKVDILKLRPTMFVHTLVSKIFSEASTTPSGAILSDTDYQRLLIENFKNELLLTNTTNNDFYNNVGVNLALGAWSNAGPLAGLDIPGSPEDWKFNLKIKFQVNAWTVGMSTFTMEIFGVPTTWSFYSHASAANTTGTFTVEFEHFDNWDGFLSLEIFVNNANVDVIDGYWKGVNQNNVSVNFKAHIIAKTGMTSGWSAGLDLVASTDPDIIETIPSVFMSVSDNIEGVSQKDLIRTVADLYGIIFKSDPLTNTLYFKKFKEIVDAKPFAKNWTDKLHMEQKTWNIQYRLNYGQKNWLRYKEDSGVTKELGDGFFLVDDQTLPAEKELFSLPFAASDMEKMLEDLDVPLIDKIDEDGDYSVSTEPRLLVDDTQNISGSPIDYNDGVLHQIESNDIPLCYFKLPTETFNIDWPSMLALNYTELIAVLDKLKKFTGLFNLTEIDIAELDHFIPVYLEQFSSYFYINKVVNYTGRGLTKVELIRI